MEITFANLGLKKVCEETRVAKKRLGAKSAKRLQARLADLMAVSTLGSLPAGRPHPLKGARTGQFAIRLDGGHRLVLEANDDPVPTTNDGGIDWPNVASVTIVFIGDYHD